MRAEEVAKDDDHPLRTLKAHDAVRGEIDGRRGIFEGVLNREGEEEETVAVGSSMSASIAPVPLKRGGRRETERKKRRGVRGENALCMVEIPHNRPRLQRTLIPIVLQRCRIAPVLTPSVKLLEESTDEHRVVEVGIEAGDGARVGVEDVDHTAL